jgi:hypothetical protein
MPLSLARQCLLSITGGAVGILIALWLTLTALFSAWRPPVDVPVIPQVPLDTRGLLFAAAISFASVLLFGLVPALQSTGAILTPALKSEAPLEKLRKLNLRDLLVCTQVALSVT